MELISYYLNSHESCHATQKIIELGYSFDSGNHKINIKCSPRMDFALRQIRPERTLTASLVFFENKSKVRFDKQQRRAIYEYLIELEKSILTSMGLSDQETGQVAWRIAVESWLEEKG